MWSQHNKEKYKEMVFDTAETALGFLALIGLYSSPKRNKGRKK
jgi:hypothetical protein